MEMPMEYYTASYTDREWKYLLMPVTDDGNPSLQELPELNVQVHAPEEHTSQIQSRSPELTLERHAINTYKGVLQPSA
ncbi:MAG: hypothetical protein M1829_002237 [Trizodia sp. TS-e1964]|nr:MAG: hypothetical protein M1829_002237 [Trizodia sp. TS-e1964]